MKTRFWVAVSKENESAVITLLRKAGIGFTNKNGMFIFDAISLMIGLVVGLFLGIVVFK